MRMPNIHISIDLDPKHSIENVRKFVLEECFENCFIPLYYYHPNELGPDVNLLDYDKRIKASILKKGISLPKNIIFGEKYNKDVLAGSFLLRNIENNLDYPIVAFMQPELKEQVGKLVLDWSMLDPSLKVQVHYSEWKDTKNFYVGIDVSQGLWGMRHKWLNAMHSVLREQSESDVLVDEWLKDIEIFDHLKEQADIFSYIEQKEFDFEKIRKNIWNTARNIQNKFSSNENSILISPDLGRKPSRPVDIPVYYLKKLPETPIMFPDSAWIAIAWYECFGWYSPDTIKNRTISYWANHPSEEKFMETITYPKLGWKGTWPAIIETITKRPETPRMIHQLLSWIADPNWPGAGIAWNHIYKLGKRVIPYIDEAIVTAKECDDDWWEEILRDLKEDIVSKSN
ncbi:MAG: DUF5071 domain-containing protein [Candidatus Hermodarchaeota archaeon]